MIMKLIFHHTPEHLKHAAGMDFEIQVVYTLSFYYLCHFAAVKAILVLFHYFAVFLFQDLNHLVAG